VVAASYAAGRGVPNREATAASTKITESSVDGDLFWMQQETYRSKGVRVPPVRIAAALNRRVEVATMTAKK
jgi:hypothetical protein